MGVEFALRLKKNILLQQVGVLFSRSNSLSWTGSESRLISETERRLSNGATKECNAKSISVTRNVSFSSIVCFTP